MKRLTNSNFWAEDKRRGLKAELKDYDDKLRFLKKEARLAAQSS